ncbi:putative uncharacterized protein [Firmicutes bacterium CAG:646]|nr:putative uncharacterized protein [Firmicutes bacterium CAG:646]
MSVLKEILDEIKKQQKKYEQEEHENTFKLGAYCMSEDIKDVIRRHMDNHNGNINEMVNKWIPVEDTEHTPENESYVLVSFSNCSLPNIARYKKNEEGGTYYPGDDEKSYLKYGIFVNAWMPLPEPYKGEQP